MFSFLIDFFNGYIEFSAEGADSEGFLTYCIQHGIDISEPFKKDFILNGKINIKDYKKLRKPAKKYGLKLRIQRKRGFYFFARKNRNKIGFLAGIIYIFAFCILMNRFVWEINIIGNTETSAENIMNSAGEMGLLEGTFAKKHFVQDMEWYILKENKNLASVEINIQGSVANILVDEMAKEEPMVSDDDIPTNIVASRYGVIRKVEVFDGQSAIKVGDAVMKGDLLVSAVFEDRHKKLTLKHARANIIAETDYNITAEFPLEQIEEQIGEICGYHLNINFLGHDFFLGKKGNPDNLPFLINEKEVSFFGIELPIKLIITRFFDVKQNTITYNFEEGKEGAFRILGETEKKELGNCEIISRRTEESVRNGKYIINADYIILMNIAEEQPIESDIPWENTDDMS